MRIRPATAADADAMVELGEHFVAQTTYRQSVTWNPTLWRSTLESLLAHPASVAFVADEDGQLVGMLGGIIAPHVLLGELTASELFWWVEPDKRSVGLRLLRAFEDEARVRGATRIHMIAPSARVEQLYEALGYRHYETVYERRLTGGG